jgi:hypothetical protein
MIDDEDELFSRLEFEMAEDLPPDRDIRSVWRNLVRPRIFSRWTITTHNNELSAALHFPWGFGWTRAGGWDWCPHCSSLSPHSMHDMIEGLRPWSFSDSMVEFSRLVSRGEMDPSSRPSVDTPTLNSGYGMYAFSDMDEPGVFFLVTANGRFAMTIKHIYDLPSIRRASLIGHMNRIAPSVHWVMDEYGDLMWSPVSLFLPDPDDGGEDDDEDPNTNQEEYPT